MNTEDMRSKHRQFLLLMIIQLSCLVVLLYMMKTKSRRRRVPLKITEHRERVRDELMKQIIGDDRCRDMICMSPQLVQLFGKDRATGEHAETGAENRAKRKISARNGQDETIDEIDHLIPTNEVTLEGFDTRDDEFQPFTSPEGPSDGHSNNATSAKNRKRAKKVLEDSEQLEGIAKTFNKIAESFDSLVKEQTVGQAIWAQLEEIGVEQSHMPTVYMHLVQHPQSRIAFNGLPVDKRKEMLPHIVPGYPPSF